MPCVGLQCVIVVFPDHTHLLFALYLFMYCINEIKFKQSLVLFCGTSSNSGDQDQTPQNAASDQVLHCLLTECSIKTLKKE